jgi:N-acetylneuraminic acid mutarotase
MGPFQAAVIHASQDTLLIIVPDKLNIPASAISVSIRGNSTSSKDNFNLIPPVVTGFSPTVGTFGSQIMVNGDNFTANPKSLHVFVDHFEVNASAIQQQHLTFFIPDSLNKRQCNIKIVMNNLSAVSADIFRMEHFTINDFTPKTAKTGMTITLTGSNFSPIAANNIVTIGGLKAVVTQASVTSLSVTLPLQNVGYYPSRNVVINAEVMGENLNYTDLLYIKDQWFRLKDAPIDFTGSFSTVVNNKFFVGVNDNKGLWSWSPASGEFVRLSDFPGPERRGGNGFFIGNSIYFGTGVGFSSTNMVDFWAYDISSDSWVQKANFSGEAREGSFAFSVNGNGYLGGGVFDYPGIYYHPYGDLWKYDPSNDNWAKLPDLGTGVFGMSDAIAVVVGNDAYVGLGWNYIANPPYQDQRWFSYATSSNTWTSLANFPFSRQYEKAIAFNLNGVPYAKTVLSGFYSFNSSTGSWQAVDTGLLPNNASGIGFAIGNIASVGIGKALWEYDPAR